MKRSKRYLKIVQSKTKEKKIELQEIIELVKKNSTTKFDESIDVSLKINLKQTKGGDFLVSVGNFLNLFDLINLLPLYPLILLNQQ